VQMKKIKKLARVRTCRMIPELTNQLPLPRG
jgi:hypothetical protein